MKKATRLISLLGFTLNLCAQDQAPNGTAATTTTTNSTTIEISPYTIVERGAHDRVWQRVTASTFFGATNYYTNQIKEVATGLHYWNGNQWVDSSDQIRITPNGASATNSQHQVTFAPNINTTGAIILTTPDGQTMTSQLLGLSYYDSSTGKSVLFAEPQDSIGQLQPSGNQVIYTNAFSNAVCDVLYTHRLSGFEQDIVVRQQLPAPASYGLSGNSLWLQVWTEFAAPPSPRITPMENGDSFLDFGVMKMGSGKAFMLGAPSNTVPVVKDWVVTQGRTFLVESVPLNAVSAKLAELPTANNSSGPANSGSGTGGQSNNRLNPLATASLAPPHVNVANLKLPAPRIAKKGSGAIRLARANPQSTGLVLDYNAVNGSQTNFVFQGDTTYYISGTVNLYGTNIIEGGAVIKFTNSPTATITATNIVWQTAAYRPAIFTAKDDDSVGGSIPGSAGSPGTNLYANVALDLSQMSGCTVSNARFSCLTTAIGATNVILNNVQVSQCGAVLTEGPGTYHLKNVLASGIAKFFPGTNADGGSLITAENVTVHNCSSFFGDFTSTMSLTNCLLIAVTNWQCATVTTNCVAVVSNDTGIFQTAGAGAHYLADNTYRGWGTTNIDPNLLSQLKCRTTYVPLVFSNLPPVSANTNLVPQALRDTGTNLDLGYHYDPLDYIVDNYAVSNATLTITNGAAIACYNENVGIGLEDGSTFVCIGTPTKPNWFTHYSTVQEQPIFLGSATVTPGTCCYINPYHLSNNPNATVRFSKFSGPSSFMLDTQTAPFTLNSLNVEDCEFWAGGCQFQGGPGGAAAIKNCLFVRSGPQMVLSSNMTLSFSNNLVWHASFTMLRFAFRGGSLYAGNNIFDTCALSAGGTISNGYNAYLNMTTNLNPSTGTDITSGSGLSYESGPLGDFYQPTNSLLLNMGSTNANLVGLYHYTVLTNQLPEGTNRVSMGYHYVAVDGAGNPIDINSNGIPDYLENSGGPVPPVISVQPGTQAVNPSNNVTFSVVANGDAPLAYQWALNGTPISGATASSFTTNSVQLGDDGAYSVAVSNIGGTVTSSNAYLSVVSIPTNGLQFWLRADAGVHTNTGGAVSLWTDMSGSGNDASQSDTNAQPQWVAGAFTNGLPAIHFNATNSDYVHFNAFLSGTNPAEAFVVLRVVTSSPAQDRGLWRIGSANDSFYPDTGGNLYDDFASWGNHGLTAPNSSLTNFHIYGAVAIGNCWTNRINGEITTSDQWGSVSYGPLDSQFFLGRGKKSSSIDDYFDGDIAEVLIYGGALTGDQRAVVGEYLSAKYGIVQSIPATASNLTAAAISPTQVSLFWNSSLSNAPFFRVERSVGGSTSFTQIAIVDNSQSYIDAGLTSNTLYYYRVKACSYAGDSGYSSNSYATTPTSGVDMPLTNVLFWLKADAGHQADTGLVPGWLDQSGYHNQAYYAFQESTDLQPEAMYIADSPTHAGIHFSADNFNFFQLICQLGNSSSEAAIVLRVTTNMPAVARQLWQFSGDVSYYPDTNGTIKDSYASASDSDSFQPVQPLTQFHLYDVVSTQSAWTSRINGVVQYQRTNNSFDSVETSSLGLNGNGPDGPDGGDFFDGDIEELMIFDRALSDAERKVVGAYLQSRYNLSTAPTLPTNSLLITGISASQLSLNYVDTSSNLAWVNVERKTGASGTYGAIGSWEPYHTNGFVDNIPSTSSQYYYRFTGFNYAGSSPTVEIAPPTAPFTPTNTTPVTAGTNITIQVPAVDPDGTVAKVDLYNKGLLINTLTNSPFNFTISTSNGASLILSAKVTDNTGNTRLSAPANLPIYPNTSGDGRNDGMDIILGLDPSTNTGPPFNPSDTNSPVINLVLPTNATPVP